MILITGGARSGKSSYGESLLKECNNVLYIATSIPFDDEMKDRVAKHKSQRPSSWDTLECYEKFKESLLNLNSYDGVILDCITIMVSNIMLDICKENTKEEFKLAEEKVMEEVKNLLEVLKNFNGKCVLVTNEVGFGVVPESKLGRYFRDIAGRANQYIAKNCSEVYLVVASMPVKIK